MMGMDCINQQARERNLTKRSQAERLAIADSLIASVWEEYLNDSIDRGTLQVAAYIQANANRIVWKLNELNNPNTPNTLEALDCISRQQAIDAADRADYTGLAVEDVKKVTDEVVKELKQLPSAQPTLCGYDIDHLMLIAAVLRKENLPPERVTEALTDIGRIISIVRNEFEESLRKAVEQCKDGGVSRNDA